MDVRTHTTTTATSSLTLTLLFGALTFFSLLYFAQASSEVYAIMAIASLCLGFYIVLDMHRRLFSADRDAWLAISALFFALYNLSLISANALEPHTASLLSNILLLAAGISASIYLILETRSFEKRYNMRGLTFDVLAMALGILIFCALYWHKPLMLLLEQQAWHELICWAFILLSISFALNTLLMGMSKLLPRAFAALYVAAISSTVFYLHTQLQGFNETLLNHKLANSAMGLTLLFVYGYLPRPKHQQSHVLLSRHCVEDFIMLVAISALILAVPIATTLNVWQAVAPPNAQFLLTGSLLCLLVLCARLILLLRESLRLRLHLRHDQEHDSLTNLLNRKGFSRAFETLSKQTHCAVLCVDLDDFKSINDHYGHHIGDQLLIQVANRLQHCTIDSSSTLLPALCHCPLARLGDNEFAFLIPHPPVNLNTLSRRIIRHMTRWWMLDEVRVFSSVRVGVSGWCDGDLEMLIQRAANALYAAKQAKLHSVHSDTVDYHHLSSRQHIREQIQTALSQHALSLCLQPIYCSKKRDVYALEALARIQLPSGEWLQPAEFLPIVEADGLHLELIREVISVLSQLPQSYLGLRVSINLPIVLLDNPQNIRLLDKWVKRAGLRAEGVCFEILETQQFDSAHIAQLHTLKSLGYLLAIDDFGTGYANLERLGQMPVDILKVDRSLIEAAREGQSCMLQSIVDMALHQGYQLVAEGVETMRDFKMLQHLGIHLLQGYFIAKPVPIMTLPLSAHSLRHRLFQSQITPMYPKSAPPSSGIASYQPSSASHTANSLGFDNSEAEDNLPPSHWPNSYLPT